MLSKFQTKDGTKRKKFSRNVIASIMARDFNDEINNSNKSLPRRTRNHFEDRKKNVRWQSNPLYKTKTNNTEDSESESLTSFSSVQSHTQSEFSSESGYRSSIDENHELRINEILQNQQLENCTNEEMNFRKAAAELLGALSALGANKDVNDSVEKVLEECEHELEKLSTNDTI